MRFPAATLLVWAALCLSAAVAHADDVGGDDLDSCAAALDPSAMSALIDAASADDLSSDRRQARDTLFRDVTPCLRENGHAPHGDELAALSRAASQLPCGGAKIVDAAVEGDLAWVATRAGRGGCTYLMRRDGFGWAPLMPLGWTLGG